MPHSPAMVAIVVIVTAMSLGGLVAAAILYMRAINALGIIIGEKRPSGRSIFPFNNKPLQSDIAPPLSYVSVYRLILGAIALDISDDRYRQLLRWARKCLIVCAVFWMAIVIEIGWFFQNSK